MGNNPSGSVSQHVEQARKTGVCSLRDRKLTQFPEQLQSLQTSLRTLDLSMNKLPLLPPSIGEFTSLRTLTITHNKLAQLPEAIGSLKKLETLNLEGNLLTALPDSCVNLKVLKTVNLSHNHLEAFPLFLCQLTRLDFADLSGNAIQELPRAMDNFNAVELNVNRNSISILPASIAKCKRLKVLRVEENTLQIGGIPPTVLADSHISLLCVEGNVFEMKELQDVHGYEKYIERYTATQKKRD